jgi:hypothetical protein
MKKLMIIGVAILLFITGCEHNGGDDKEDPPTPPPTPPTRLTIKNESFSDLLDVQWQGVTFVSNTVDNSISTGGNTVTKDVNPGSGYIFFRRKSNLTFARTKDMVTIGTNESTEFVFTDNTLIVEANNPDNTGTLKDMATTVVFFDDADGDIQRYAERKGSTYYSVSGDLPYHSGNTYYHPPYTGTGKSIALGGITDATLHLSVNLARKGTISFQYANQDYQTYTNGATFSIDGSQKATWQGNYNWASQEYNLEAGSHEIVWTKHGYYRDNFYHYSYLSLDNILVFYNDWVPPPPSTAKAITGFRFTSPETAGSINEGDKSITVMVPYGTNPVNLTPTITVSPEATVTPRSGQAQDFTNPVTYTVTAQDGSTEEYDVRVTIGPPSTAKVITGFRFTSPEAEGSINEDDKIIDVLVPYGTSLVNLTPTITVSPEAMVNPNSDQAQDFTNSVTYTVTAQDGSTVTYTVRVTMAEKSQGVVTLIFPDKAAGALDDTPITISRTNIEGKEHTFIVNGTYIASQWWVDGVMQGTGSSLTLSASAHTIGVHRLTLEVITGDNLVYSKQLTFRVER